MGGIVLAGGRSERMGRDKALLPWRGTTLLEHVAGIVGTVSQPVLVVADLPGKYSVDGVRVVGDSFPGAGPLGGLVTGLEALGDGFHFAVACDMPLVNPSLLRLLIEQAAGFDGAAPEVRGHLEPLCAVYDSRCAPVLRRALESGERAIHLAVRSLNLRRVPEAALRTIDPRLESFANLNSLEEYERADAPGRAWRRADGGRGG